MKLIVLALFALSAFGQAPVGSGITQPSSSSGGLPTYAQAGGTGSPNTQACIVGYPVVQYTASGQTQIYTCGASTANQYGIAPAGTATSCPNCSISGDVTGTLANATVTKQSSTSVFTGLYNYSTLPTASTVSGKVAIVTDCNSVVTCTGGGTPGNLVFFYSNGTSWTQNSFLSTLSTSTQTLNGPLNFSSLQINGTAMSSVAYIEMDINNTCPFNYGGCLESGFIPLSADIYITNVTFSVASPASTCTTVNSIANYAGSLLLYQGSTYLNVGYNFTSTGGNGPFTAVGTFPLAVSHSAGSLVLKTGAAASCTSNQSNVHTVIEYRMQ